MTSTSRLRAGDWVRVRSKEEILATLDATGRIDGLPFMPEMLAFCGQAFRVASRAHKTCDPPTGLAGRRLPGTVHLEGIRCDGAAHGGCQARCLLFWKEAWLEQTPAPGDCGTREVADGTAHARDERRRPACSEETVWTATRDAARETGGEPVFVCQSTQLPYASTAIRWWDLRQYWEDYASGNVTLRRMGGSFIAFVFQQVINAGIGLGTPLRLLYDSVQKIRGGTPYPWRRGAIAPGSRTPSAALNLQPGELVRVKSYEEILSTVTDAGMNRGMSFDAEMVKYCGGVYRVLDRVTKIINEKTGRMHHMKNDCIILDQVVCQACYAEFRRFCPRRIYPYWREIWLDRVTSDS